MMKTRQALWETRSLVLIVAAVAAIAGVLGFKLGQKEPLPQPPVIIQVPVATPK